jgi:MSHA biogenesis protein MshN
VSLINKMLQDLETRQNTGSNRPSSKPLYDDLHSSRSRRTRSQGPRTILIALLLTVSLVAGGYYAWNEWGEEYWAGRMAMPKVDVARTAVPVSAPEPQPEPATPLKEETVAQPPVVAPSPAPAASKPVITGPTKLRPAPAPTPLKPIGAPAETTTKTASAVSVPAPKATVPKPVSPLPPKVVAAAPTGDGGKTVLGEKKLRAMSPEDTAESAYRQAADLMKQGRAGDAEPLLRSALVANAAHIKARELLVGILLQGGRGLEARQLLQQGIEKSPRHYSFAQLLARLYVQDGADPQALALLESVRPVAGNDPEYQAFLAALYQRAGKHTEAVKAYGAALGQRPQEGRWWLGLGISHEAEQNFTAATESYQKALASGNLDGKLQQYVQQRLTAVKSR